ncbi:alpha/beta hydrolase [Streptosporangium carneum]|uniref:Peptidase n=1 Tax=Streptosporangium carneum TaxID=47481 RepID=A0A9W6I4R0_9ACTN|nr:alpha/beta hydrolase [Streptosporangium carneum]GLK12016.1 peptidase [Streptosporangium carneum]
MRRILAAVTATTVLSTALAACGSSNGPGGYGAVADISEPSPPPTPATPSSVGTAPGTASPGQIAWGPCTDIKRPDGATPRPDPRFQCGRLRVPLDYNRPNGDTLDMAVIRIQATEPGRRLGSLVFNFGGPGASGVDTMAQSYKIFSSLNTRYDLVSFDPPGVERTAGVRCGTDREMDRFLSMDTQATNAAERAEQEKTIKNFVEACKRTSGKVLPYVGTVNAARDMDRLRQALGDKQLNYFGISYGTQLGAVYATQFPKKVHRFALDGPLDPSVTLEQRSLAQTTAFQKSYDAFLQDCIKGPGECEVGADASVANKNVETFLNDLRINPLPVGDRKLTQGLAVTGVTAALYSDLTWPLLEQGLSRGFKGDGRILLYLADAYNARMPDGSYATIMSSFPAITCVDTSERPSRKELAKTEEASKKISPLFGGSGMGAICSMWPVPGSDEARKIDATGSAPILVIGGTGDPATPYEWAPRLTEQLRTGVLVTYKGEGHGAYLSGDSCVKKLTDGYLLDGKVPANGAVCPSS